MTALFPTGLAEICHIAFEFSRCFDTGVVIFVAHCPITSICCVLGALTTTESTSTELRAWPLPIPSTTLFPTMLSLMFQCFSLLSNRRGEVLFPGIHHFAVATYPFFF
jgi:hypothetical protein